MNRTPALVRLAVALVCFAGVAVVALVGQDRPAPGEQMVAAADQFLGSLTPELRKKATFEFDDPERTAWFFTPQQDAGKPKRKGVRFEELDEKQKEKALVLLRTGTSAGGYDQATTIMSLESILREVEKKGSIVRNPNWYFVSVFGKPAKTGKWGWRIEGHHLSVNFTIDRGEVESPTPLVFGANPATVKAGDRAGLRAIPEVEDRAKELIKTFDEDQKKVAHRDKHFPEIAENTPAAKIGDPEGIPGAKLTEKQREALMKLLEAYAARMPGDVAAREMKAVKDAGIEKVYFAYSGEAETGKAYTYQIQGPTFVVQFLNVQADGSGNPANHIHSVWRRLPSDFGLKEK
jgi:Protein of unknown function (DUF3500)